MHKIVVSLALASLLIQANAQELNMEKLQLVAKDVDTKNNIITATGDVVAYSPTYYLSSDKSGSGVVRTIDGTYDPTTWKIMEVDENGNITKWISNRPERQQAQALKSARTRWKSVRSLDIGKWTA